MIAARRSSAARAGGFGRALAAQALRLATGETRDDLADADWAALHALAERERLAPLAWLRSGARIAAAAPPEITDAWRRSWAVACARGYRLLAHAGELTAAVETRSGIVIALKGASLAQRLYGDVSARPSTDIDVFVPPASRALATGAAIELGWSWVEGTAPGDEVFVRREAGGDVFLEVHATLLGERLRFLPLPQPTATRLDLDGVALSVFDGPLEPAYLAAHLAAHHAAPLLWWLDWWTLWSSTDDAGRTAAARAATECGLGRYLRWAERRAAAVDGAVAGDERALAALGVHDSGARRDVHQVVRHVRLAPTAFAATAAVREWVRPSWAGERDGGPVTGTLRRIARHWRLLLPTSGSAPVPTSAPRPRFAGATDAARIAALVAAGQEAWLPVGGQSMAPTIAAGDSVLLTRARPRPRPGDIVLSVAGPVPMLHRVIALSGDEVTTRGDACDADDPIAPAGAIVARAIAMRRGEVVVALTPALRFGVAPLVRHWVRSLRRHGWRRRQGAA